MQYQGSNVVIDVTPNQIDYVKPAFDAALDNEKVDPSRETPLRWVAERTLERVDLWVAVVVAGTGILGTLLWGYGHWVWKNPCVGACFM
ncbi:MAG: hypothetical protein JXQ99_24750 [Hyphomicrobiaceae bacterium]